MLIQVIVLIVLLVIILIPGFLKFNARHSFKQDQLIQKEKDDRKLTFLYKFGPSVGVNTSSNIQNYTMISDNGNRSLIVSYEKKFSNIVYYVYMYSISNKLIGILEVEEHATKFVSESIELPSTCKKVNIKVVKVNDELVETNAIKTVSFGKLFFYSIFVASFVSQLILVAATALFPIYEVETVEATKIQFINLCVVACASLIYFLILLIVLIKRNKLKR